MKRASTVVWHLLAGRAKKPLVRIIPDEQWEGLHRIVWPDGMVSPPANITRCKDAARRWIATEFRGQLNAKRLRWQTADVASLAAETEQAA